MIRPARWVHETHMHKCGDFGTGIYLYLLVFFFFFPESNAQLALTSQTLPLPSSLARTAP